MNNRGVEMRWGLYISLLLSFLWSGCSSLNKNPDILLQPPYNRVKYISNPQPTREVANVVQVTTKGISANILNTIPQLYLKALETAARENIEISHLRINSYTKQEEVYTLVHDCFPSSDSDFIPQSPCAGQDCSMLSVPQVNSLTQCITNYRTDIQDVLYQEATADILSQKKGD